MCSFFIPTYPEFLLSHLSHWNVLPATPQPTAIHSQPPPTFFLTCPLIHTPPPPRLCLPLFICHSCCLNCLSGSIRLSKQRCYTVPACYKYLWCVSHSTHHPSSPFPSLSEILSSLFSLPSLFSEIHRKELWGSRRNPVTENKKEKSCGGKNTPWPHFTVTMSLRATMRGHSRACWLVCICKAGHYSPLNSSISVGIKNTKQQSQYFDFQEKNNIVQWNWK